MNGLVGALYPPRIVPKMLFFRKESCQGTRQDWNFPSGATINQIGPPVAPAYP